MVEHVEYGDRYVGPDNAFRKFGDVIRQGDYTAAKDYPGTWERVQRTVTDWVPTPAFGLGELAPSPQTMTVYWYDHDCEWISKYCDEHHRRVAEVPVTALEDVAAELGISLPDKH